jgi:hypothetical protein
MTTTEIRTLINLLEAVQTPAPLMEFFTPGDDGTESGADEPEPPRTFTNPEAVDALVAKLGENATEVVGEWLRRVFRNWVMGFYYKNNHIRGTKFVPAMADDLIGDYGPVVEFLNRFKVSYARLSRVSVFQARETAYTANRPSNRHLKKNSKKNVEAAQQADVTWNWGKDSKGTGRSALIHIGPLTFHVAFMGGRDGEYRQGWGITSEASRQLDAYRKKYGKGSNLFPKITQALRETTVAFLTEDKPNVLRIDGADGKRNAFNAKNYGSWTPEGYSFKVVRPEGFKPGPDQGRASDDGVIAVAFVRDGYDWKPYRGEILEAARSRANRRTK